MNIEIIRALIGSMQPNDLQHSKGWSHSKYALAPWGLIG